MTVEKWYDLKRLHRNGMSKKYSQQILSHALCKFKNKSNDISTLNLEARNKI